MEKILIDQAYNDRIETFSRALLLSQAAIEEALMRSYSLNTRDNSERIKKVFCKAARGESVTIAAIGGSITQGASAKSWKNGGNNACEYTQELDGEKCWFERTAEWFCQRFPQTKVNAINAGIGATPSFLGAFRLEQMVLQYKPDLVTVEFSVNDPSTVHNLLDGEILDAYEAIVRRCLEAGAAVLLVFLNDQDNNGMQRYHSLLAEHYDVPCISYHNAIYPEGKLICDWERLSPDEIHPNNVGHALLAACICNYLDWVYAHTNLSGSYCGSQIPQDWLYHDTFYKVTAVYARELADCAGAGFQLRTDVPDCTKWDGALVDDGSVSVRVTVPKGAKRVFVQYFNSVGSFETEMNGHLTVCNTSPVGWPKAMWHRVYTGDPLELDVPLHIQTHEAGQVILLGVLSAY